MKGVTIVLGGPPSGEGSAECVCPKCGYEGPLEEFGAEPVEDEDADEETVRAARKQLAREVR